MTFTNSQRADRCAIALAGFSDDDLYTNLVDWLSDSLHWCDLNDHEFDDPLATARMHFGAELSEALAEEVV